MDKVYKLCIAMKAIITDNRGRILLLRKSTDDFQAGKWDVPGGRIEIGEYWQDALRREVFEETGLELTKISKPVAVSEWRPIIKGETVQIVATFLLCQIAMDSQIKLSKEHDDFAWVKHHDLAKYEIIDTEVDAIEAAFEEIK
jgi:8-oxo-dGTP diphosphatase